MSVFGYNTILFFNIACCFFVQVHGMESEQSMHNRFNQMLFWAARTGHSIAAHTLLGFKADVNARDRNKDTPLHCAVKMDRCGVSRTLIAYGAHINAVNNQGNTPLHEAMLTRDLFLIDALLAHPLIDVKKRNNTSMLAYDLWQMTSKKVWRKLHRECRMISDHEPMTISERIERLRGLHVKLPVIEEGIEEDCQE